MNRHAYETLREEVKDVRSWEHLKDAVVKVLDALQAFDEGNKADSDPAEGLEKEPE